MEKYSTSTKFIDRLELFMQEERLNNNKITVKANLSNGLIGKALKNRTAMNSDSIENILLAFPLLNADWLMTGRGEMLLPEENTSVNYFKNSDLLKKLIEKSEEVGQLKEEVKQLKSSLGVK